LGINRGGYRGLETRILDKLKELLVVLISAPVKPGAVHRLRLDPSFEARLAEVVVIFKYVEEAFRKGRELAQGSLDSRSLGLGGLFARALRDSFEFTGRRPLIGLVYASLSTSIAAGYSSITGRSIVEEARRIVRTVLYGNEPGDTISLIEGLEAVGASDYLLELERHDITKRSVSLNMLSIGDLAEKLQGVDCGFLYNIRGISKIKELYSTILKASNLVEAIIKAYYIIGTEHGMFERNVPDKKLFAYMVRLEKENRFSDEGNSLLGGVFIPVAFRHLESSFPLP
jgi:hypothetical protein